MPDRDRASVHIDLLGIEAKLAHHSECLNRESLVQLVEINVFILPTGLLPEFPHGPNGGHHDPGRIDTACSLRHDSHHRLRPQFFGFSSAGHDKGRGAIIHTRCVASSHGAIFLERRLEGAQNFDGGVLRGDSSLSKMTSGAPFFFAGSSTGTTCDLNRHSLIAATALRCEFSANWSCSSRVIPYFSATFSPVIPMW